MVANGRLIPTREKKKEEEEWEEREAKKSSHNETKLGKIWFSKLAN